MQQQRNLHIHETTNDNLLAYSKIDGVTGNAVLVVVNLDSRSITEGEVIVDLEAIGQLPGATYDVTDLPSGNTYEWSERNYVRLDPDFQVAHIFQLPTVADNEREATQFRTDEYDPRA